MLPSIFVRLAAVLLALPLVSAPARSDDGPAEPESGAPYVPSPHSIVTRMLELADVQRDDYVIDLGSGDGRIVLTAAKLFGARGLGVEIRQDLVERSRRAARLQGVEDRVHFVHQDLFHTDLSRATLVTVYLLPETLARLRDKLLDELSPGTRVMSHDYPLDNWSPERFVQLEHPEKVQVTGTSLTNLYLYRVPADIEGRWLATVPGRLNGGSLAMELSQVVTAGEGWARLGDRQVALENVEVKGRRLSFVLPEHGATFRADVEDGRLQGTVQVGGERQPWHAVRR